jgi:hypothetical protein
MVIPDDARALFSASHAETDSFEKSGFDFVAGRATIKKTNGAGHKRRAAER